MAKQKTTPKESKFNLFKTITSVLKNDIASREDIEKIPPFIFRRWLANHPNGIFFANVFNLYNNIPIYQQYIATRVLMKGRTKYIEYPKKIKDNEEQIKILMKHYKISNSVAREYYDAMGEKRVEEIFNKYNKIGMKG
jgi:hypothetical protein